jgi:hypothetical protein
MDSAKKQLDQWDYGTDTITITGAGNSSDTITTSTIDLSSINLNSAFDYSTLTTSIWSPTIPTISTGSVGASLNPSGKITLSGEDADIVVNGVSLMSKIEAIAERLNILDVNQELEQEWDQLRELGERYRELEQEFKEKSAMWKTLKTKTPSKPRS